MVLQNAANDTSGQPVLLVVVLEGPSYRIESVETILRSYPERAKMIEVKRIHPIIAQRFRIVWMMFINLVPPSFGIETMQARLRSQPEVSVFIFLDLLILDGIPRVRCKHRQFVFLWIESSDASICRGPHGSIARINQTRDRMPSRDTTLRGIWTQRSGRSVDSSQPFVEGAPKEYAVVVLENSKYLVSDSRRRDILP